jgi:predicted nucleic acid-binding Zn ribbon protein
MRNYDVARIKDLLGPVGKRLRLQDPVAAGSIWRKWPEIVGEDIARNAEPSSLKDGVLRIRTSSPTWATEMTYMAADIKRRVNEAVGKPVVVEVKVWTTPAPIERSRRGEHHSAAPSGDVSKKTTADDPKTAFERAFEAWSKRRSGGR